MASNEHKNLVDPNIHNPKGYADANNGTVLSKLNSGSGYNDGALSWIPQTKVGATNYELQGYLTGANNYFKGEDIANTRSPYLFGEDYGASTITTGVSTIDNSVLFRTGMIFHVVESSIVKSISGYITSNNANNVQIAICKVTPTSSSSPHVIDIIDEFTVTGGGSNDVLVAFNETVFVADTLTAADIIFPMVREDGGTGSNIYLKGTIQSACY